MTLTNPWFLLGLFALSIPVVLHLFELRRPQRVLFTNVEFIKEIKLVTARQRRLQHLAVLALRLGFISFLVLMFCQPFIPAANKEVTPTNVVVAVDRSPSMGLTANDGKVIFEKSLKEAERLASSLPRNTLFSTGESNSGRNASSVDLFKGQLSTLNVSAAQEGPHLSRFINRNSAGQPLFILSDFQKSNFKPADLKGLKSDHEVYLLPFATAPTANVYIDSVFLDDELVRVGTDLPLQVKTRNGGSKEANGVQIRVLIGGQQVASYRVNIAVGQSVINTTRVRLTKAEAQQCRVEVEEQSAGFDNIYYFTLLPAGKIKVLDVSSTTPATQRLYPNESIFTYSLARSRSLTGIEESDVVILQGESRLIAEQREGLRRFVQDGGTLVIVPAANNSLRREYEQLFADLNLAAIRWIGGTDAPVPQELAPANQQSPFFKDVFAEQTRLPDMPKATPLITWARSTMDVLKFRDGQPFLSGFRRGAGTVYVFASPLLNEYSTFTEHPLFVPVMYRLATLSKAREQQPAYRLTDRSLVLRQPAAGRNGEQVYKLVSDSSTFIPTQQLRDGRLYLQLPMEMRKPGFYNLTLDGKTLTKLAFNVDKKESELAQYTAEELRQLAAPYPNVHVYEAGGEQSAAARLAQERAGTPLWRYCLWAALLCLLGEVLVLRFAQGRNRTVADAA